MSKIEVLVTTMHQHDFRKYTQMNLQTSAVIANQCNENKYEEQIINGSMVKLISTTTRGVSRNRNLAIAHSSQNIKYLLFADDDLIFNDGYEKMIVAEFEKHPEAEAIKFNLHDLSNERTIYMGKINKFEKATRRNMSSSGMCGMVISTEALKRLNLHFNEDFGPGEPFYCGEDSLFIADMFEKGSKMFRSPVDIAGIDQSVSSWYTGFNEKLFYVRGAYYSVCHPYTNLLWMLLHAYRTRKISSLSFWQKISWMMKGKTGYVKRQGFEHYEEERK